MPNLILTRKPGESIVIDGRIVVTFLKRQRKGNHIELGISAPADVPVMRQELLGMEVPVKPTEHPFACGNCPPCTGGRPDQCVYRDEIHYP